MSADYSQIELRIMAHLSDDPALLRAFHEGADIHRATAADIFGVPLADVTADQRRYIKAVNFGLIYGMSAFGLAQQLGIERGAAQQFIDKYFQRYPGVATYMRSTRELAREHGYVETVFGRRLWLPDIKAAGGPRRAGAERAAINAPMQGTAADLVKLAMIAVQHWIDDARLATRLVLQVHDELVLEVPEAELAARAARASAADDRRRRASVPLVVDVGVGPNWEAERRETSLCRSRVRRGTSAIDEARSPVGIPCLRGDDEFPNLLLRNTPRASSCTGLRTSPGSAPASRRRTESSDDRQTDEDQAEHQQRADVFHEASKPAFNAASGVRAVQRRRARARTTTP